jgi:adenylate cyclase
MPVPARRGLLALIDRLRQAGGKRWAEVLISAAVALMAAVLALGIGATTPFRFVENVTYDLRQGIGAPPSQGDFVIVKIDDDALNAMREASPCHCLSPMNKAWLGDVIKAIGQKGAKAILVDYLIDTWEPDGKEFAAFQADIASIKTPVIAAVDPALKAGVDYPIVRGVHYADARALVSSDYDDVMRRYDPKPGAMWSLAAETGRQIGVKPPTHTFNIRYRRPDPKVAAENSGAIGPSFSAAFAPVLPDAFFKDKIVLIGRVTRSATAEGVLKDDTHATPLRFLKGHEAGTPGVEVHAHALSQMRAGDSVNQPNVLWKIALVLLAALLGAWLGRSTQNWWFSIVIVATGLAVVSVSAFALYRYFAFMAPMTTPAVSFAVGFFVLSRLAAAELNSQRAFYSSTLERYLAPQVIDRMVGGQESVTISAEERDITVMISDLENFSNMVASLDLETFAPVINEYLGGMLEILWKHEAMIDKMTGDGVIAIFGAPVLLPDHADRAIACAREIRIWTDEVREKMLARGVPFGVTRMGISSGVGMVGNFGGERRFNYTAYGEVVVIAARLEAANKTFNTRILFSAETLKRAKNHDIPIRPVGEIDLKGVPVPIPAFTVDG